MNTETFMKIQQLHCAISYELLTLWLPVLMVAAKMEMVYPLGSVNVSSKLPHLSHRGLYLLSTRNSFGLLEAPEE